MRGRQKEVPDRINTQIRRYCFIFILFTRCFEFPFDLKTRLNEHTEEKMKIGKEDGVRSEQGRARLVKRIKADAR